MYSLKLVESMMDSAYFVGRNEILAGGSLNERRMEETERRDGFNRDDMEEFNEAWSTEGLSPE
ncbi:hypothetical protein DY000_02060730 [Brassica cretica]|uniref:Uncharacterized protein n=1 Tax=Brassica cretica TaxID=69181 RepID=A0ABQ7B4Q6_BRACR|nr:hypothetical protein DY000_02060730 [Brassica cretica]